MELVFSLHKRREGKLGMFATSYTNIWPIFRMIICRILKKQWKLWLPMCINALNAAINLEVCGFIKNTKIQISWEWNIFSSNKKNYLIYIKGYDIAKSSSLVEVIFKCIRPVEMKKILGGYQLWNIVGHHGWPTKNIFHFKSSKRARKT